MTQQDTRGKTTNWRRSFADWRPGLIGAAVLAAVGAGTLALVQRYLYSSHLLEAAFAVIFLCYCAVVLGYSIARGHDDTLGSHNALARATRNSIPYTGKRLAVAGLALSLAFFVAVALVRTPGNIAALEAFAERTQAGISEDDTTAARLTYVEEGYKSDPRAFWRKLLLGIDSLQVKLGDQETRFLVPEARRDELIARMRSGEFVLSNQFSPDEQGSLELLEHLHALRARRTGFVLRTFAFTLMESFGFMAGLMYVTGLFALVVHRRERTLRQRLYASLDRLDWDRLPRVRLVPASTIGRWLRVNPLLHYAVAPDRAARVRVSHADARDGHGVLIDLQDARFGGKRLRLAGTTAWVVVTEDDRREIEREKSSGARKAG